MNFKAWIMRRGRRRSTAEKYAGAIFGSLTRLGIDEGILRGSLGAMESPAAYASARSKLEALPIFVERNARGNNMYSRALALYAIFLEEGFRGVQAIALNSELMEGAMLSEKDKRLISYFRAQPKKEATATEVMAVLGGYKAVIRVNDHVAEIAKNIAGVFSYIPSVRSDGTKRWWPCLFDGRQEKHGFVWTLRKDVEDWYVREYHHEEYFLLKVKEALQDSVARAKRLAVAQKKPAVKVRSVSDFDRNPDVVAEVLSQASGKCQRCGCPAPFIRKSDSSPYLEVHHKISLASGGEDTVANAIALCPNCHREVHYG
jgi:predicted HNH restriction endonuclease